MNKPVWEYLKKACLNSPESEAECLQINSRRILFGAPVAILLHATFVLFFILTDTEAGTALWKQSLIIIHSAMLMLAAIAFLLALYLRKRPQSRRLARFLQYYLIAELISGSIAIVAADQLMTTNIAPYIIVSLAVGAFFLMPPLHALILYSASFCIYYFVIALGSPASDVLLSNRVNGLASAALGFILMVIMWQHHYTSMKQREYIGEQHKALEEANKRLERMAYYDWLTGLPNRQHFDLVLQKEISLNSRMGYESYLIMLDIDLFKNINDIYGHPTGDALLIEIGRLLSDHIRKYDTLSRMGGEEFMLLLPQTSADEAVAVAEKLRHILEAHTFFIKDHIIHVTASFGVSRLSYTSDPQLVAQYAQVDNALYLAKQCGRNCVKIA